MKLLVIAVCIIIGVAYLEFIYKKRIEPGDIDSIKYVINFLLPILFYLNLVLGFFFHSAGSIGWASLIWLYQHVIYPYRLGLFEEDKK